MNSIAIMQPYIFPYIGYFQLINEVDKFVFYDDVNFIKRGWINRNKVLINNKAKYFTIPCINASQNRLINDVKHGLNDKTKGKLLNKIKFSYNKAPQFDEVYPIIERVLNNDSSYISDIAIASIKECSNYLEINCEFGKSSQIHHKPNLSAADRLIDITKGESFSNYVNPIGGKDLYTKDYFRTQGVDLFFLKTQSIQYEQYEGEFVPWLSIIDIMMFNTIEEVKRMLEKYKVN